MLWIMTFLIFTIPLLLSIKTLDLNFQVNILDLDSKEILFSLKPEDEKLLGKYRYPGYKQNWQFMI